MCLEEAIELLRQEYERAQKIPFVQYPLAYALFQTWKKVDRSCRRRRQLEQ